MKKYILNTDKCRRCLLLEPFPRIHQFDTMNQHSCCDICTRKCQCEVPCIFQPSCAEQYCTKDSECIDLEPVRYPTTEQKEELKICLEILREEMLQDGIGIISNFPSYVVDTVVSQIQHISE